MFVNVSWHSEALHPPSVSTQCSRKLLPTSSPPPTHLGKVQQKRARPGLPHPWMEERRKGAGGSRLPASTGSRSTSRGRAVLSGVGQSWVGLVRQEIERWQEWLLLQKTVPWTKSWSMQWRSVSVLYMFMGQSPLWYFNYVLQWIGTDK